MRRFTMILALAFFLFCPGIALADGLILQLPADGTWAKFEVEGEGVESDGTVSVTVKGTQTLRSVGKETIDNQPCRWIELESDLKFERADGRKGDSKEIIKLLIPESQLIKGTDPRKHVVKAYRGISSEMMKELDLKGDGQRDIQSLDEFLHAPLEKITKLPAAAVKVMKKDWKCEGFEGEEKTDNLTFATETRTHKEAPFGVVTYKYVKTRRKNNESQGGRHMKWKLAETGTNAKSAAPKAQ